MGERRTLPRRRHLPTAPRCTTSRFRGDRRASAYHGSPVPRGPTRSCSGTHWLRQVLAPLAGGMGTVLLYPWADTHRLERPARSVKGCAGRSPFWSTCYSAREMTRAVRALVCLVLLAVACDGPESPRQPPVSKDGAARDDDMAAFCAKQPPRGCGANYDDCGTACGWRCCTKVVTVAQDGGRPFSVTTYQCARSC